MNQSGIMSACQGCSLDYFSAIEQFLRKKYSFSSVSAMSQSSAYLSDGQKVWQQRHLSRGKARVKVLGECRCPLDEEMEVLYSRDVVHDGRPS